MLEPFAVGGVLDVPLPNGSKSTVTLAHIQLEQDSGKTVQSNTVGESLVDLNRAGSALMEIVSNADIRFVFCFLFKKSNAVLIKKVFVFCFFFTQI